MEFEDNTTVTTFAEANEETSGTAIATPQNLPALSSAGKLTAPLMPDGEPAPVWEKNYTNLVQFSDPEITKAAIESIAKRCSKIDRLSAEATKRLWWAVAESVLIFHLSDQKIIDALCRDAGIKKPNKRGNGKRPNRHFVRLVTRRFDDPTLDNDKRNTNNKEVGRYARYFDVSLDMLLANPERFYNDPVRKLAQEFEKHHGLERFVKGDEDETDDHTDDQSSKSQAPTPAIATPTSSNEVPAADGTHLAAPMVRPGSTTGVSTHDHEPEYWPLVPQHKIDGSEPDQPRIARARNLWEQKWLDQLKNRPNVQEITLANPPPGLHETTTFLLGSYKAGTVKLLAISNLLLYQADFIRLIADHSPCLAPLLVKALSDMATTKVLPSFMMEHSAWDDHLTAVISRSQLSLITADTFLLSSLNNKSRSVIRFKLNSPAIKGTSFPLALQADHFGGATMWDSHGIGGAIASDTLVPSSNGSSSYELAVDWCFSSELLSFEPFPDGVWQADFDFGSFEPEYEATMNSRELTMLQFEVLTPWIEAFGKRKLAKRKNVQAVHLHLDDQLAIEFNESPAGGVEHSYAMQTRKKQGRTLSLAFNYDDLLPVLCFLTHENASNVDIAANPDGIAFYVDLGYAHFSIYVPALTTDGSKTKDVLFTQFP